VRPLRKLHFVELNLSRAEAITAVLATALVVGAHVNYLFNAGGLWRDEVNTLNVATRPSFAEFLAFLKRDSFPVFWPLLLRLWSNYDASLSEIGLRLLGTVSGLLLLAALWFSSLRLARGVPLCSLVLVAASPTVLEYGDSLRAYGVGTALLLLAPAVIWNLSVRLTPARILLATLIALLGTHSLYNNLVLLCSLLAAGAVVVVRGSLRRYLLVLSLIAVVCTLSVFVLYSGRIAADWNTTLRLPVTISWLVFKFNEAVEPSGQWIGFLWLTLLAVSVHFCFRQQAWPSESLSADERDLALFVGVALVIGVVGYFVFLIRVGYITEPWYYISIMAFLGALLDPPIQLIVKGNKSWRIGRLIVFVFLFAVVGNNLFKTTFVRKTNVDYIASHLEKVCDPKDLIVVDPWFVGITFGRYYHGGTPWTTLPEIEDHLFDRRDLIKKLLKEQEPIMPLLSKISSTLQNGGRVWFVELKPFLADLATDGVLPDLPEKPRGLHDAPYVHYWSYQAAEHVKVLGARLTRIAPLFSGPVNLFENLEVFVAEAPRNDTLRARGMESDF